MTDQKPEYDALQSITDSFYYTYLYFEGTELVAHITNDDYCAWTDVKTNVIASTLWDVDEFASNAAEFDLITYLTGYDYTMPDTIFDGSPHPHAGEVRHDEGMSYYYKKLIVNNLLAGQKFIRDNNMDDWEVVEYNDEDTTLEAIRREIAKEYLERFNKEITGDDMEPDEHVVAAIQMMRDAGVWPSDLDIPA